MALVTRNSTRAEPDLPNPSPEDLTDLLRAWTAGDEDSGHRVMEVLYRQLKSMARRAMKGEKDHHTLQPTALVHEAFVKLVHLDKIRWQDRAHFLGAAAGTMRRILVDHARSRGSVKRGGEFRMEPFEEDPQRHHTSSQAEALAVHEALSELSRLDERKAKLVELRYFGGLEIEEAAEVLGCSRATVTRQWRLARVWLRNWLYPETPHDA